MAAASYESQVPPELLHDDGKFYPSNDTELMWVLSEESPRSLRDMEDHENGAWGGARWPPFSDQVKELVTQKLEPDQAERLLPELKRLFRKWNIYPPG